MIRPAPAAALVHYPSSDGKPMAENDAQRNAIMYGINVLTRHFKARQDVYDEQAEARVAEAVGRRAAEARAAAAEARAAELEALLRKRSG